MGTDFISICCGPGSGRLDSQGPSGMLGACSPGWCCFPVLSTPVDGLGTHEQLRAQRKGGVPPPHRTHSQRRSARRGGVRVVDKLVSVLVTDVYEATNVPTVGDSIKIPAGAKVSSIVISQYKLVSASSYLTSLMVSQGAHLLILQEVSQNNSSDIILY